MTTPAPETEEPEPPVTDVVSLDADIALVDLPMWGFPPRIDGWTLAIFDRRASTS